MKHLVAPFCLAIVATTMPCGAVTSVVLTPTNTEIVVARDASPAVRFAARENNIVLPSVPHYVLNVESVTNGDGSVTFTAKYSRKAFMMVVR